MRLVLVGTGGFAQRAVTPAIRAAAGVRFHGVCSRDLERARAFAATEGAERAYGSFDEMLRDRDVDALWLVTPDPTHEPLTVAAAHAGKHVLCEKPLAISSAAARRMRDACAAAGVRLGVAYNNRHHPAQRQLCEWVRTGALGRLVRLRLHFSMQAKDASNWRAHSPNPWWTMAAVGTHLVDLAYALSGEEPADVDARFGSPVFNAPNEEVVSLTLGYRSGLVADIDASVVLPHLSRIELLGTQGVAVADGTIAHWGSLPSGALTKDGVAVALPDADPYRDELLDFARAVAEGRPPLVDGEAGARNLAVLEAATRANAEKRRVEVKS